MRPMNVDVKIICAVCIMGYITYTGCKPDAIRNNYSKKPLADNEQCQHTDSPAKVVIDHPRLTM